MRKLLTLRPSSGFTLIELLIVIAILIILVLIGYFFALRYFAQARDAVRVSDVTRMTKNLEVYHLANYRYPDSVTWSSLEQDQASNGTFTQAMTNLLKVIPHDPLYPQTEDTKIYSYQYKTSSDGQCYKIHVDMEARDPYETGIICNSSELTYTPPSGGGGGGGGGGDGGDQVQRCLDNSPEAALGYVTIWENTFVVDKAHVYNLGNDCSGLTLTVWFTGDMPNDGCEVGADPERGRASAVIVDHGDNINDTFVDYIPNLEIEPLECVYVDVSSP